MTRRYKIKSCIHVPEENTVPCGKKRKRKKIATHKRKKKLRKNRHKSK
jgi:hypothetical protein